MALDVTSTPTADYVDCEISSDDDLKTNSKLKSLRPLGLARITSRDDSYIEQDHSKRKSSKKTYPQTPNAVSNTKRRKKTYPHTPNPVSNTKKKKKKLRKSSTAGSQKIGELQAQIKSLSRDNRVLQRKLEKIESTTGKKQRKMDNEREMRLAANKERFALKQKLEKLQKAISVRLKLLGVDFSKINDITTALDTAFNVIQKLAKQLQQKEEEFNQIKMKMTFYGKMKKEFNAITQQNAVLVENGMNLKSEIEMLRGNIVELNEQKTSLSSDLDNVKGENVELIEENKALLENKNNLETNVKDLMISKERLESELERVMKEYDELKNGLFEEEKSKLKNKCKQLDELNKEYVRFKEDKMLKESEYKKSIKMFENKLKVMKIGKEKIGNTISVLHEEIGQKNDLIKSQKKKIKKMQKELDMAEFGDNKKFSQMSLLKTNVENMHNIIRDKDNKIKTLTNKLRSLQKELDSNV